MRLISLILFSIAISLSLVGAVRAGSLGASGPNPNWSEMQKFEWYLGHMARAASVCGTYEEAAVLTQLARMTPYGKIGLGTVTGDGFVGPVCGRINNRAKELAADADRIREHIEVTYDCQGKSCHGQSLDDWQFHACGNSLKSHFAILGVDYEDVRDVSMLNPRKIGYDSDFLARVRLHSCKGSLYIGLTEQCIMEKSQTRGDCEIEGVERY